MAVYRQEKQRQRPAVSLLARCCSCAEPSGEMQLLECLHWFCKGCLHLPDVTGALAGAPDIGSDYGSAGTARQQALRCPLCMENVTLLASAALGNRFSTITETKASADRRMCDVSACEPPAEAVDAFEKASAAPSVASCWCTACSMFLCDSCAKHHARFAPTHRDSVTKLQPPSGSSLTTLTVATRWPIDTALPNFITSGVGTHHCACSLFCLDCHRPACPASGCLAACVDVRHSFAAVDGERMRTVVSNAAQKLLTAKNAASGVVNILLARRGSGRSGGSRPLPPSQSPLDGCRAQAAALLDKHRQSARDLLRAMRDRAATRTRAVYDAVHGGGRRSRSFQCKLAGATRMTEKAKWYAFMLVNDGSSSNGCDGAHVLHQQRLVLCRVRTLTADIERLSRLIPSAKMPLPIAKRQIVSKDSQDLSKIVSSWIGTPSIAGDDVPRNVALGCNTTCPTNSAVAMLSHSSDNQCGTSVMSARPLRFGSLSACFQIQCDWRDVTMSADGNVLIAARRDGMYEYSPHGELLGIWRPTSDLGTSVVTLRALSDGRVVVGVNYAHAVVILRRSTCNDHGGNRSRSDGDTRWHVEKQVALRARPQCVSTFGSHLIAVSGTRTHSDGYELDVVRADGGSTVLSRTLDFTVILTALTARALIVSAGEKRRLDNSYGPAVEAYSYSWSRLWQLSVASDVREIWPQPFGHVLTMGVAFDRKMMAVDASSGRILDEHAARIGASLSLSTPRSTGMAACYDGRRALLVVLMTADSTESDMVELYSAFL